MSTDFSLPLIVSARSILVLIPKDGCRSSNVLTRLLFVIASREIPLRTGMIIFFWVDSTAFPLYVSLKSKILSKDYLPKLSRYDAEACEFLRTCTYSFWKFPEPFLCWVGISRYYTLDENSYPTFWDGEEEMDLFAFIGHSDPTKVRIGERNLADREIKLLKMTEGRTILLNPPVTAAPRDSGDSIDKMFDEGNDANQERSVGKDECFGGVEGRPPIFTSPSGGKSLSALRGMVPEGSAIPSDATEPLVTASVTPMSDVGLVDSVFGLNLRTRPPRVRYVVSSDSSHYSGSYSETASLVRSPADVPVVTVAVTTTVDANVATGPKTKDAPKDLEHIGDSSSACGVDADAVSISKLKKPSNSSDSFYASQSLDTKTMHRVYVPRWKVTNDAILDDLYVCRDMTDRLAPALFAQLRAMDFDQLYFEFNVGVARQVCVGAEVRMRAEHTLERKSELEDRCAEQATLLSDKDAEIAHPRSLLSLKEAEAAKAISLRSQLSVVEAADAAKGTELRDLKEQNFALEGEKNVLSERVETLEFVAASNEVELPSLSSQVVNLTADLSVCDHYLYVA
uniref:Transposase (Putative), gypsy type n=1 Tax=Tanacetum cinerariifolium TaxID=118510 RepID=A0A6L2LR46_TANCI|nr:hypothetical protein [Tanacetum cinerariifolium]